MKYILLIFFSIHSYSNEVKVAENCNASKEYITAFNYLSSKNNIILKDNEISSYAKEIITGCNNSAKRFINVFETLVKASVDSTSSLKYALKYAKLTDNETSSFITIFKESFLKDFLDLDIKTSLRIASELIPSDPKQASIVKSDFHNIVKFCKDENSLELGGLKCAEVALSVAASSVRFNVKMSDVFIDTFNYLISSSGPSIVAYEALEISKKMISYGPKSLDNFKETYEFLNKKETFSKDRKALIILVLEITSKSTI